MKPATLLLAILGTLAPLVAHAAPLPLPAAAPAAAPAPKAPKGTMRLPEVYYSKKQWIKANIRAMFSPFGYWPELAKDHTW